MNAELSRYCSVQNVTYKNEFTPSHLCKILISVRVL